MNVSEELDQISLSFLAVPLNSLDEGRSIGAFMSVCRILDQILGVVVGSLGQSLVVIKRSQGWLVHNELFGFFPGRFAFDGFVEDVGLEFDVGVVHEGVQLLINEGDVVFGILSGEVEVF
jgi:hypothetical protein